MKYFLLPLLAFSFLFVVSTAQGQMRSQPQCSERTNVIQGLAKRYKEIPIAAGVTNTGGLIEVLSDREGRTWTIIVTSPQGMSCLVAAGEGWRNMEQDRSKLDPEA